MTECSSRAPGPASPWRTWNTRIVSVIPESPGVTTFELVPDDEAAPQAYRFQPGQFNMLYVPGVGESAISISGESQQGKPHETALSHTIRAAGRVTQEIFRMKPGDCLGLRGPYGSGWPVDRCLGQDVILVAGGIGMAPLRPVVRALLADRNQYGSVSLLMGARTSAGLLYSAEWPHWAESIDLHQTVDRADNSWDGHVGVVTTLLERLPMKRPAHTVLMTCGPEAMMWYAIRAALDRGLDSSQAWLSLERNMNCAVGFCGHCQLGPEFICRDGPVVPFDRIAPFLKVSAL